MDLDEIRLALLQYVSEEVKERLEENDWFVDIDYVTIKKMFDPVIERILRMIRIQLEGSSYGNCSVIFLIDGFSQSKYLQKRIKQEFQPVMVSIPSNPLEAISRGATIYGLSLIG